MIVALKENSRIYIGYNNSIRNDGQVYHGYDMMWKSKLSEVYMAAIGDLNIINEIRLTHPFPVDVPDSETCATYLHSINSHFKSHYEDCYDIIICGSAKIFTVSSSGVMIESGAFTAIGAGRDIALSTLDINSHLGPEARIHQAFKQATKYCPEVFGDVEIKMI